MSLARVLHLSTETGFRGGEQQVLNLMRGLSDLSVPQALLSPAGAGTLAELCPDGVTHFPMSPGRANRLSAARALRYAVQVFRPTILHAHTSHAHSLARLAQTLLLVRQPLVVTRRVDFPLKPGYGNRWKYLSPAVRFIAISEAVRQALLDGGVPEERIRLVHSGVDPLRLGGLRVQGPEWNEAVLEPLGLHAMDGPLWICVAALVDHKDHRTLLRALKALEQGGRTVQLALAGDGDLRTELESLTRELGLSDRVHFLGRVDTRTLAALHRAATGFVMTSKLEGLGTAVLDAMAAGVPVVATAAGGIPESVLDGKTGWLCPIGNEQSVARAMEAVTVESWQVSHPDSTEVRRRVEAAHAHVLAGFTQDSMVSGTLAAYHTAEA